MYNKTIQLNPDDFRAYVNKGIVLGILKKYNLALKAFDAALKLNINDYKAHLNKGLTLEKLGKYDLSLESYNKALELEPNDFETQAQIQAILDMQKAK